MAGQSRGEFEGRVAWVTGAASGIGRATALAFARAGASVACVDVAAGGNEETAAMIERLGGRALALRCDVSQAGEVRQAVEAAVGAFGRLDAAFNNAGVEHPMAPLVEISEETWERVTGINLRGTFLCMKYEIPRMLAQGGGAIVNMSSVAGVKGFAGLGVYAATKHGVIGMTRSAALDYARTGLRINAICPGAIATAMMDRLTGGTEEGTRKFVALEPVGRMGRPEEIAAAVVWLCSDAASFVHGHAMLADGAMTA